MRIFTITILISSICLYAQDDYILQQLQQGKFKNLVHTPTLLYAVVTKKSGLAWAWLGQESLIEINDKDPAYADTLSRSFANLEQQRSTSDTITEKYIVFLHKEDRVFPCCLDVRACHTPQGLFNCSGSIHDGYYSGYFIDNAEASAFFHKLKQKFLLYFLRYLEPSSDLT